MTTTTSDSTTLDTTSSVGEIGTLVPDWERSLRARNRSPRTIAAYGEGVRSFVRYLTAVGMPKAASRITHEHCRSFIEHELATHAEATAQLRFRALSLFFTWLVDETEIEASPMAKMRQPPVHETDTPLISEDQLRALFATASGMDFTSRRDAAIMRLLYDTGARVGELANLKVEDVDRQRQVIFIRNGKGERQRSVDYGDACAQAVDRYARSRASHRAAASGYFFVGNAGHFTPSGIRQMLSQRGRAVGIERLFPHMFRHSFANSWLADGGAESDLMQLAGWRSGEMLRRYGRIAAADRAHAAYRRQGGPGDKL